MVRHVAQATSLAVGLGLAALLAACGGGSQDATGTRTAGPVASSGRRDLGEMRQADCAAWRRGDEHARRRTIHEIAGFAGGPVGSPAGHGARLPDDIAYRFFDRYCTHGYATYFKLYKLYTRAAAFTPRQ